MEAAVRDVIDELGELACRSSDGVVIDFSAGTISPEAGVVAQVPEAVVAYHERLATHFQREGVDVTVLQAITLHYRPTGKHRGTIRAMDDRGTEYVVRL